MKKIVAVICFVLNVSFMLISCNGPSGHADSQQADSLQPVNKTTLIKTVSELHQAMNVKDYSVEKGMQVIEPLLSKYKICIPGFSKMVPYDESYLYVYCIYDTVQIPPRVLSFRFQLPKPLQQQLTTNDLKKSFEHWQPEDVIIHADNTKSTYYNAGSKNLSIIVVQQTLPNRTGSIITDVTVLH